MQFFKESKEKIVNCMRELEHEPENDFELDIITNPNASFIPSLTNINKLKVPHDLCLLIITFY